MTLRLDQSGRDVTDSPGLWDEGDSFIEMKTDIRVRYQYLLWLISYGTPTRQERAEWDARYRR